MTQLIAFPFHLTLKGNVATREDGTQECYAEELALLCMTKPAERELVPEYGLPDTEWEGIIHEALASKVEMFGPSVAITSVQSSYPRDGYQQIVVEYEPLMDEDEEGYDD